MLIKVAKDIGFCFGVRRAVEMAEEAACAGTVYTLGELIHNEDVIHELEQKGIHAAPELDEVPAGGTVVIRSHGVGEQVYAACAQRGLKVIDATCPFVLKIHALAQAYHKAGKNVILFGKAEHPEVVGIRGWCEDQAYVAENVEDIDNLPPMEEAYILVQTTFSATRCKTMLCRVQNKVKNVHFDNTICNTTAIRQQEAEALSKKCTHMIVIGGKNSSNTQKLCAICQKNCEHTQTIAKVDELFLEKYFTDDIIGVVAGASTPDWKIREVVTRMSELEKTMAESPEVEVCEVETEATATVEEPAVAEAAETTATPAAETAAESSDTSFAEAFEKTLVRIRNGQIITGSVVQIVDGEVCVNIGYKSDGFIPRSEFSADNDVDPAEVVKVGDSIEVEVLKVNDGEGNVLLSRKNVESKKMWDDLMQDENVQDKVFEGVGKEVVKGGLIANIDGVRAFIPASQLSTKYVENIGEYVGKPLSLKVIEVDKSRKRIVASHKAVMLMEAEEAKKKLWDELVVGEKVQGIVRRLTDFGAFVDIGGIDGLVHVTDVAWGRVKHPSDVLSIGQEIEVLIRDVDVEKQRVSLGYKQLQPKPWTMADEKYPVGSIVEGKVVRIVPFGAFVALEPTIDGLIHISQVGVRRIAKVEDEINVGDVVRCKVLDVNPEAKRISLSRREVILEENPDIAEQLAAEKAERERIAAERAEQRSQQSEAPAPRQETRRERDNTPRNSGDRPERGERRSRREDSDYELPPVQQSTTSLAALFSGFSSEDEEK
ncbi:MAG: bifunctional 4-hydroxy-3-methylbut-2-enyl diphosphate reductase/30S ribosomal protein S1 [Clostridia bacterium]|nr:bifunctional 4-hydroxy-3-methylbut-2-enyl diphosphate reductase/30S ribosomal protein S1 [Clostridia bacterium]